MCLRFVYLTLLFAEEIARATSETNPCYFWADSQYVNGKCFKLFSAHENYVSAQSACNDFMGGGYLAEIGAKHELGVLVAMVKSTTITHIWTGLTDHEGVYTWANGHGQLDESVVDFQLGSSSEASNDCVVLGVDMALQEKGCTERYPYVCQRPAENPCHLFLPGAEYFSGHCLLYVAQEMTAEQAQDYCSVRESFLLELRTPELYTYVQEMTHYLDITQNILLGGVYSSTDDGTWLTSGVHFRNETIPAQNPQDFLILSRDEGLVWRQVKHNSFHVICQRDVGDPCEEHLPSGVYLHGSCFKFFAELISWTQAKAACIDHGAFLAELKSKVLADSASVYLSSIASAKELWLGASDALHEKDWIWVTSGDNMTYKRFSPNEPNNSNNLEHYLVHKLYSAIAFLWDDRPDERGSEIGYLCQRNLTSTTSENYITVIPQTNSGETVLNATHFQVTSGFASHDVYLRIRTSSGEWQNTFVSWRMQLDYTPGGDFELQSPGVYEKYITIWASHHVTVVVYLTNPDAQITSSALLYPLIWTGDAIEGTAYFALSGLTQASSYVNHLAVVSTTNKSTDVAVILSVREEAVGFQKDEIFFKSSDLFQASAILQRQYQSMYSHGMSTVDGMFVSASQPVVLFVESRKTNSDMNLTDQSFDEMLPVTLIDKMYVVPPPVSLTTDTESSAMLKVVSTHANTTISGLPGQTGELNLMSAGDTKSISLRRSSFFLIQGNKPFYASMIFFNRPNSTLTQSCFTSLLPQNLWRHKYDFTLSSALTGNGVYLLVVVETKLDSKLTNFTGFSKNCTHIAGTSMSGCIMYTTFLKHTQFHLLVNNYLARFAVYLVSGSDRTLLCHPLGVRSDVSGTNKFSKEEYFTHEPEIVCSDKPNVSNEDFTTTFAEGSTASVTEETPDVQTTTTTKNSEQATTECPTIERTFNWSEMMKVEKILKDLLVKAINTSAYKRTKISVADPRPSAKAIGFVGIVFVTGSITLIVASDAVKLCRYLFSLVHKRKR